MDYSDLPREVEGIDFRVSGIQEEDPFVRDAVYSVVVDSVKKLTKMLPVSHFSMHIKMHKEGGKRTKYSTHASIRTDVGEFFAKDHDWDIMKATKLVLGKLEREVYRKEEKMKDHS
ncbi:MAG: hypothetical protein JSV63_04465 [Candidatus Aenigmatarchaeota archaeon]|nr:MAG: hypothetical protein JSV63_04465 [Candidatus Aenigmarchaeota archaeon]